MLRRFNYAGASSKLAQSNKFAPSVAPKALQRRAGLCDCLAVCPLAGHFATIGSFTASNLMFTPLATVALVVLAFNVNYVGLKHLWYTSEFPMRDYIQDAALKQALRYMMLISLLLAGSGIFVEA